MGGSSAARNFCHRRATRPVRRRPHSPNRFSSADNNKIVWVCKRGGLDVIMRYSATGSSDGVNKLLQLASNPASNMLHLDHTLTTGCTGPTLTTRTGDGKQYNNTINCNNGNTINLPTHMGASDVQGASFHQTGPLGTSVTPLDDTTLNSVVTAIVPFSLYAGKGVVKLNAAGTASKRTDRRAVPPASRTDLRRAASRTGQRLGFGTVTDAAPGTLEATSPIVLCLRNAGSGTKAAFDETVMINATETPVASALA